MVLGGGLNREEASETDPPAELVWSSDALTEDLDLIGDGELVLSASATAADTAWIVTLSDVDPSGTAIPVTAGYLRASLRTVDEESSPPGAPKLNCRTAEAVPVGETVRYRIPFVPNARRLTAGHCLRLTITSDDQPKTTPAVMGFRHATVGTSSLNTVFADSRLLLPVMLADPGPDVADPDAPAQPSSAGMAAVAAGCRPSCSALVTRPTAAAGLSISSSYLSTIRPGCAGCSQLRTFRPH